MELLDDTAIAERLRAVPGWERREQAIVKTFTRKDFADALTFVNQVGEIAEEINHHPDIDIRWNKVTMSLSTHFLGGITENDFGLAERIERVAAG